jgi:hypothetical protein
VNGQSAGGEGQKINGVPQHRFVKMAYFALDLVKNMR